MLMVLHRSLTPAPTPLKKKKQSYYNDKHECNKTLSQGSVTATWRIKEKKVKKFSFQQWNKWFKQAWDVQKHHSSEKSITNCIDNNIKMNESKLSLLRLPPSSCIPSKLVNESASIHSLQNFSLVIVSGREGRRSDWNDIMTSLCAHKLLI